MSSLGRGHERFSVRRSCCRLPPASSALQLAQVSRCTSYSSEVSTSRGQDRLKVATQSACARSTDATCFHQVSTATFLTIADGGAGALYYFLTATRSAINNKVHPSRSLVNALLHMRLRVARHRLPYLFRTLGLCFCFCCNVALTLSLAPPHLLVCACCILVFALYRSRRISTRSRT